jgi:prepilin-type N-terminal cleavage/methylation domain-containing protein
MTTKGDGDMGVFTRRLGDDDEGFTLIELLVVMVLIAVLASIAIPVFLNQRSKADDATAKGDLRNLADFEEIYLNDYGSYSTLANVRIDEPNIFPSKNITLTVVIYDTQNGYCLSALNSSNSHTWYYDSEGGGLQPRGATGCPDVTSGLPGGSVP